MATSHPSNSPVLTVPQAPPARTSLMWMSERFTTWKATYSHDNSNKMTCIALPQCLSADMWLSNYIVVVNSQLATLVTISILLGITSIKTLTKTQPYRYALLPQSRGVHLLLQHMEFNLHCLNLQQWNKRCKFQPHKAIKNSIFARIHGACCRQRVAPLDCHNYLFLRIPSFYVMGVVQLILLIIAAVIVQSSGRAIMHVSSKCNQVSTSKLYSSGRKIVHSARTCGKWPDQPDASELHVLVESWPAPSCDGQLASCIASLAAQALPTKEGVGWKLNSIKTVDSVWYIHWQFASPPAFYVQPALWQWSYLCPR